MLKLREEVESLLKIRAPLLLLQEKTGTIALGEKDVVDHRYEAGNRIGEYEIKSELGEGGFGIVYFAKQHEPVEREVAIKVLHSNRCTDIFILGFEAERQTLANMSHPGIAHFLRCRINRAQPTILRDGVCLWSADHRIL